MSLETDLRGAFLANANLAALIGSRFYFQHAPQNATLPLIVYWQNESIGERTLSGMFVQTAATYDLMLVTATGDSLQDVRAAVLELAGTSYGSLYKIDVNDGPDDFDYQNNRYTKMMDVQVIT